MLLTFKGQGYVHFPWSGKDLISYHTLLSKFLSYVTSDKIALYKEKLQTSAQDPCKLQIIFSSLFTLPAPPSLSLTSDATFFEGKIEKKKKSARTLLLPWLLHHMFRTLPSYICPKHIFFFFSNRRDPASQQVLQFHHLPAGGHYFHIYQSSHQTSSTFQQHVTKSTTRLSWPSL